MNKYLLYFFLGLLLISCNKEKRQAKKDDKIIQDYMASHNLVATKTESGLYIVINNVGQGTACNGDSDVTVAYTGYLNSDEVFDQSTQGATFNLRNVIKGWTEGIPHFKEGGSGKLLIPSALGYGDTQKGAIPANSVLIFDIQLLDVL